MAYDNTNRGTIGKNTRKEREEHPDITGSINVEGVDYWLNGWLKTNQNDGSKFYSLTVRPKQAPTPTRHEEQKRNGYAPNDDIPFAPVSKRYV